MKSVKKKKKYNKKTTVRKDCPNRQSDKPIAEADEKSDKPMIQADEKDDNSASRNESGNADVKRKGIIVFSGMILVLVVLVGCLFISVCDTDNVKMDTGVYMYSATESTSEYTTMGYVVTEPQTETASIENMHFNADGKLYGVKGKFSGLWKDLEKRVNASKEEWTVLKEWVGDPSEVEKCDYEEDNFKALNGYGTVHWSQSGHGWQSPYSCADKSGNKGTAVEGYFQMIAEENVFIDIDRAVEEQNEAAAQIADEPEPETEQITESEPNTSESNASESNASESNASEPNASESSADADLSMDDNSSGQAVEAEISTEQTEEMPEVQTEDSNIDENVNVPEKKSNTYSYEGTGEFDNKNITAVKRSYLNNTWGSDSCGVCSLAMVLSTLSGVAVTPPEVALAANCLIGEKAWYGTVLYSQAQAKLAELAGFPVKTEPYGSAKKQTLDDCLDKNGMAILVTDKDTWASGGDKHYIVVRNRVGEKYYTCDSGKNPQGAFTYDEIASGYNQQLIVYVYPKGTK